MESTTELAVDAIAPALRDRCLDQIGELLNTTGPHAATVRHERVAALAAAANALDQIEARRAVAEPSPASPTINVERLATDVWNAAQTPDVLGEHFPALANGGFGASAIADVAANAVRKVLS